MPAERQAAGVGASTTSSSCDRDLGEDPGVGVQRRAHRGGSPGRVIGPVAGQHEHRVGLGLR